MTAFQIEANLVDIPEKKIRHALIKIEQGKIKSIENLGTEKNGLPFLLPGFIDSHVHIESSMLTPAEFAKLAVVHGSTASISDPHEIANVCGMEGIDYMIENGKTVPFKFYFGAPSCVPATPFETAGAEISVDEVDQLLQRSEIKYLSEMMNFPGVLHQDPVVMQKISAAQKYQKPVDGHAPGLRGEEAKQYIEAGCSTDHECFTKEEALDKLKHGMKILIREGSAAKNFEALADLLHEHDQQMMFCSDDKHPDSLVLGHINQLCARAVKKGIDVFKVLQAACINPVKHYDMECGLLQPGDPADAVLVKDLKEFEVLRTYIDGILVAENGESRIETQAPAVINRFHCTEKSPENFAIPCLHSQTEVPLIEALDGQLITHKGTGFAKLNMGNLVSDIQQDILKITVINRYEDKPPAMAFIKNFGLKKGAIASTVAHDSHNIIAVGVDDASICAAVNSIIRTRGGISAVNREEDGHFSIKNLPLPVAGLMSDQSGYEVAKNYTAIDRYVKDVLGSRLTAPFMTLSFMALLVIPHIKLSDKGLFDGDTFTFFGA